MKAYIGEVLTSDFGSTAFIAIPMDESGFDKLNTKGLKRFNIPKVVLNFFSVFTIVK